MFNVFKSCFCKFVGLTNQTMAVSINLACPIERYLLQKIQSNTYPLQRDSANKQATFTQKIQNKPEL